MNPPAASIRSKSTPSAPKDRASSGSSSESENNEYRRVKYFKRGKAEDMIIAKKIGNSAEDDPLLYLLKVLKMPGRSEEDREAVFDELLELWASKVTEESCFLDILLPTMYNEAPSIVYPYSLGAESKYKIKSVERMIHTASIRTTDIKSKYFSEARIVKWLNDCLSAIETVACKPNAEYLLSGLSILPYNVFVLNEADTIMLGGLYGHIYMSMKSPVDQTLDLEDCDLSFTPETITGEDTSDEKRLIWEIGLLFYELCSLKHAFGNELKKSKTRNLMTLTMKMVNAVVEPIPSIYSKTLAKMIQAMLSSKPSARGTILEYLNSDLFNQYFPEPEENSFTASLRANAHKRSPSSTSDQGGKVDQAKKIEVLYSFEELTTDQIPEEVDVACIELYLKDDEFVDKFRMLKSEFKNQPKWKQKRDKKLVGF